MMFKRVEADKAQSLVREMDEPGSGRKMLTSDVRMYVFRGDECFAAYEDDRPVAMACVRFNTRKTKGVGPYCTLDFIYTKPRERGNGYARQLLDYVKDIAALERGCTRLKSIAGTQEGKALQHAAGHEFWDEKTVDTPLTETVEGVPPYAKKRTNHGN